MKSFLFIVCVSISFTLFAQQKGNWNTWLGSAVIANLASPETFIISRTKDLTDINNENNTHVTVIVDGIKLVTYSLEKGSTITVYGKKVELQSDPYTVNVSGTFFCQNKFSTNLSNSWMLCSIQDEGNKAVLASFDIAKFVMINTNIFEYANNGQGFPITSTSPQFTVTVDGSTIKNNVGTNAVFTFNSSIDVTGTTIKINFITNTADPKVYCIGGNYMF